MISQAKLQALFAAKAKKGQKANLGKVLVLGENGHGVWHTIEKMSDYDLGKFEGKVGTTRRSSKGRTVRMPNGSRKYIAPRGEGRVIAYKLK